MKLTYLQHCVKQHVIGVPALSLSQLLGTWHSVEDPYNRLFITIQQMFNYLNPSMPILGGTVKGSVLTNL